MLDNLEYNFFSLNQKVFFQKKKDFIFIFV